MKKTLTGGLLLLSCACTPRAEAAPRREVSINIGELGGANQVMETLTRILRNDKKSSRFRIAWGIMGSNLRSGATARYNRRTRTLKYYSFDSALIDDEIGKWRQTRESYMYRGVSDPIIARLAAKNRNSTSGNINAFFSELPLFGCRKQILEHNVTYWTPTG